MCGQLYDHGYRHHKDHHKDSYNGHHNLSTGLEKEQEEDGEEQSPNRKDSYENSGHVCKTIRGQMMHERIFCDFGRILPPQNFLSKALIWLFHMEL
jgi:hypothetical protein